MGEGQSKARAASVDGPTMASGDMGQEDYNSLQKRCAPKGLKIDHNPKQQAASPVAAPPSVPTQQRPSGPPNVPPAAGPPQTQRAGSLTIGMGLVPRSDSMVMTAQVAPGSLLAPTGLAPSLVPPAMQRSPSMIRTSAQQERMLDTMLAQNAPNTGFQFTQQQGGLQPAANVFQFTATPVPGPLQRSSSMVRTSAQQIEAVQQALAVPMPALPLQQAPSFVAPVMQRSPSMVRTSLQQEAALSNIADATAMLQSMQVPTTVPVNAPGALQRSNSMVRTSLPGPLQRSNSMIRTSMPPMDQLSKSVQIPVPASSIRGAMQTELAPISVSLRNLPATPGKQAVATEEKQVHYVLHPPHAPGETRQQAKPRTPRKSVLGATPVATGRSLTAAPAVPPQAVAPAPVPQAVAPAPVPQAVAPALAPQTVAPAIAPQTAAPAVAPKAHRPSQLAATVLPSPAPVARTARSPPPQQLRASEVYQRMRGARI